MKEDPAAKNARTAIVNLAKIRYTIKCAATQIVGSALNELADALFIAYLRLFCKTEEILAIEKPKYDKISY